jgi:predicted ATP-dependent serine protease
MIEAKNQEPIKSLLGGIWFTGELHILFGDNGTGKSVWATQIADALSKGKNVFNILPNESSASRVLFYDFELSDKQFEKRYMNGTGQPYNFSDQLYIDNINFQELHEANPHLSTDDLIINKIDTDIQQLKPKVVIIDNMTYLKTETTQEAKVALELIRKLNQLKRKYDLSILVISHTPKIKGGMPITNNDLAGSKNLSNLVDSISAIGKSTRGSDEKYIKLIKCRSGEKVFDTDSVISVKIDKDDCFLGFEYLDCENEFEHIKDYQKEQNRIEQKGLKEEAIRLHLEGKSYREIARLLCVSKSTIERWINE